MSTDNGSSRNAQPLILGKPSVVFDTVARVTLPTLVVVGIYLHFAGHNQPGGGFIAGLVFGTALVLRFVTGNQTLLAPRVWPTAEMLLGVGVLLVVGTAVTSLFLGNGLLEHHTWEFDGGPFGKVKFTSALFFDTGIALIVTGVVAGLIGVLGAEQGRPDGEDGS